MLVAEGHWAESLPPVPDSCVVTVSFASETCADEHRDALELLGYRVVDVATVPDVAVSRIADFLITEEVVERHPTYWRSLAEQATRAYHLALGPAAAAVAEIVTAHAPHLQREGHAV
jgi:hypothetical protein